MLVENKMTDFVGEQATIPIYLNIIDRTLYNSFTGTGHIDGEQFVIPALYFLLSSDLLLTYCILFVCFCQEESVLSSMMYYFYCIENNKEAGNPEVHRAFEQMSP